MQNSRIREFLRPRTRLRRIWRRRFVIRLYCRRAAGRCFERLTIDTRKLQKPIAFHIVSTQRNAGKDALKCLNSVHKQKYDLSLVNHVFIDDNSSDNTHEIVSDWLKHHQDHPVQYIHRATRLGGAKNTVDGFRMANADSVVLELNGDDWLPDPGVLRFLAKVYQDPDTWMTYNTFKYADGKHNPITPLPKWVVEQNAYREYPWYTSHLHTFRKELFDLYPEEHLVDPKTGEYWAVADDLAFYLPMLEMAGEHAKHIYRITYVYNLRPSSSFLSEYDKQKDCEKRIRQMPKYERIAVLPTPKKSNSNEGLK